MKKTSIRAETRLADEMKKVFGAKSRAETVRIELTELVAMSRFNSLLSKTAGKFSFAGRE